MDFTSLSTCLFNFAWLKFRIHNRHYYACSSNEVSVMRMLQYHKVMFSYYFSITLTNDYSGNITTTARLGWTNFSHTANCYDNMSLVSYVHESIYIVHDLLEILKYWRIAYDVISIHYQMQWVNNLSEVTTINKYIKHHDGKIH